MKTAHAGNVISKNVAAGRPVGDQTNDGGRTRRRRPLAWAGQATRSPPCRHTATRSFALFKLCVFHAHCEVRAWESGWAIAGLVLDSFHTGNTEPVALSACAAARRSKSVAASAMPQEVSGRLRRGEHVTVPKQRRTATATLRRGEKCTQPR